MKFARITLDPAQMGGVPCIRGLRIPVATVVSMLGEGMSEAEILATYPDLEPDDIQESLRYAADAINERTLPLTSACDFSLTTPYHLGSPSYCGAMATTLRTYGTMASNPHPTKQSLILRKPKISF